jgi:hypothetical protein
MVCYIFKKKPLHTIKTVYINAEKNWRVNTTNCKMMDGTGEAKDKKGNSMLLFYELLYLNFYKHAYFTNVIL